MKKQSKATEVKRNKQVMTPLKIIRLLDKHRLGISVRHIQSELEKEGLGCSKRTIYRHLDSISSAYFPLESFSKEEYSQDDKDEGHRLWRYFSSATFGGKIEISYNEILALYIARSYLDPISGTAIYKDIESVFDKIEKGFSNSAIAELRRLGSLIIFKNRPGWTTEVSEDILDTVHRACIEGHTIQVTYKSNSDVSKGEVSERTLGPIAIVLADSGMYLLANDLKDRKIKSFSLARMIAVNWTSEAYDRPNLKLKEVYEDSLGMLNVGNVEEVVLLVKEPMASYIKERRWHKTQTIEVVSDNQIRFRMKVKINSEVARWVLGLGAGAYVEGPSSLRDTIKTMLQELSKQYQTKFDDVD